jgi:hypothetical protein
MRIRKGKTIRLLRQDRPRRIDLVIDYFGGGGGLILLAATAGPTRWEPLWRPMTLQMRKGHRE